MPVEVMQGNRFGRVSASEHSFAYAPENIGSVVILPPLSSGPALEGLDGDHALRGSQGR